MASDEDIRNLLTAPRETLDLELKQWIDPTSDEGIAKIAKACIALRNNNGGRLVIGFKDDGRPDATCVPADVRVTFHIDVVQQIVSRYAAEAFTIDVEFVAVGRHTIPVITVPPGVRSPVAAKSTLNDADGKPLIKDHAVYVRSVNSNNRVSSTEARRGDWERLTRICFDNREADIGAFVRRHLSALNPESLAALVPAFSTALHRPGPKQRAIEELNRGQLRFQAAAQRRGAKIPRVGFREAVVFVDAGLPAQSATEAFLRNLTVNAPQHTGWTPWAVLNGANKPLRPYTFDGAWEALLDLSDPPRAAIYASLDFWRIEPGGVFYHVRALEDDFINNLTPGTQLEFYLQIARAAEIVSMGLSFGRSLIGESADTSLVYGFRWTGLAGRLLTAWANPSRLLRSTEPAVQDQVTSAITVPLDTPPSGISPHVENAVRDLFALFGGQEIHTSVIEDIVRKTIESRS